MAELGQTTDPTALVPGDPNAIADTVMALLKYGELLCEAGEGLNRIDTNSGWRGAAADAFHAVYHGQPGKWLQAGDAFESAAKALESYTSTLSWAQGQSSEAINHWAAGNKSAAQETLSSARSQLESAGETAATAVGKARDLAPPKPGFWSEVGSFFSGVGSGLELAAETTIDDLASLGNAAIHDPGALAETAGGLLLAGASAGGDGLGAVLDATGVGAVAGIPLNVAATAGVVAGSGLAAAGMSTIFGDATGDDRVNIMNRQGSGGGGGDAAASRQEAADQANQLGYSNRISPQKAPFNSHGQPVYTDGKNFITPDVDGHNVSNGWKMFNRRGQRIGTYDWNLTTRLKN